MKQILFLSLVALAVACGGGGGSSNGGPGAAVALPTLTLSGEETVSESDVRLKSLCNSEIGRNDPRIDPRLNKSVSYSGVVAANYGTRQAKASGTGTWENYVIEKTENVLKFKTSMRITMTSNEGRTANSDDDKVFTIECSGTNPKSCRLTPPNSDGSSGGAPLEFARLVSIKSVTLGKAKIGGKEYQAVRKVIGGNIPILTGGRTYQTGIEAEFITVPELPPLAVVNAPGADCGALAFMRYAFYQPDEHIKMEMTMLLLNVEGELTKVNP